jgi:hypothetical protein
MSTARALESMSDPGQFEILALRMLRFEDPDCRFLEGMGINADGKPIRGPLDAFSQVPGSTPPLFVMAAFTTTDLASLRSKWLAQSASRRDTGDLLKAAAAADALRRSHSDARFAVYLCTNRVLDAPLAQAATGEGRSLGVEVRFLTQSRLRDFLDTKPIGHWLRKEHLGIDAEFVSEPLLRRLSIESLARYRDYCALPPPHVLVETDNLRRAQAEIGRCAASALVVSGPSGAGKSTVSYQLLGRHVARGGIGFWISGEVAARSSSLEAALTEMLRELHPAIEAGAGATALRLAQATAPLLIVVDDIRRGGRPSEGMARALTWRERQRTTQDELTSAPSRIVVIPAWETDWLSLRWLNTADQRVATTTIEWPSEAEAATVIERLLQDRGVATTPDRRRQLVTSLGRDPVLMHFFSELPAASFGKPDEALEVMRRFVGSAIDAAREATGKAHGDYERALRELAVDMLAHRQLSPQWTDVCSRLGASRVPRDRRAPRRGPRVPRLEGRAGRREAPPRLPQSRPAHRRESCRAPRVPASCEGTAGRGSTQRSGGRSATGVDARRGELGAKRGRPPSRRAGTVASLCRRASDRPRRQGRSVARMGRRGSGVDRPVAEVDRVVR